MKNLDNQTIMDLIFIVVLFVLVSKCNRNNKYCLLILAIGILYILYAMGMIPM